MHRWIPRNFYSNCMQFFLFVSSIRELRFGIVFEAVQITSWSTAEDIFQVILLQVVDFKLTCSPFQLLIDSALSVGLLTGNHQTLIFASFAGGVGLYLGFIIAGTVGGGKLDWLKSNWSKLNWLKSMESIHNMNFISCRICESHQSSSLLQLAILTRPSPSRWPAWAKPAASGHHSICWLSS